MKEYKLSARISLGAILLLAATVCFLPEDYIARELILVLLDGGFASLLISVFSYLTEERKAIYNFYTASDRYAEKLRCFSRFLAEADVCIREATSDLEEQRLMRIVADRLKTVFDKLYEEFITIQKETREFEAFSLNIRRRSDIGYYMRKLYDDTKDVLYCLNDCNELMYRNELREEVSREALKSVYDKLKNTFISYVGDEIKNTFELIKCKVPDKILKIFVAKGYISLRKGGIVERNRKYTVTYENKRSSQDSRGLGDMPPDEYSTCIQKPYPLPSLEDDWFDDI